MLHCQQRETRQLQQLTHCHSDGCWGVLVTVSGVQGGAIRQEKGENAADRVEVRVSGARGDAAGGHLRIMFMP